MGGRVQHVLHPNANQILLLFPPLERVLRLEEGNHIPEERHGQEKPQQQPVHTESSAEEESLECQEYVLWNGRCFAD